MKNAIYIVGSKNINREYSYSGTAIYNELKEKMNNAYSFSMIETSEDLSKIDYSGIDLIVFEHPKQDELNKLNEKIKDTNIHLVITRFDIPADAIFRDQTNPNIYMVNKTNLAKELYKQFCK